MAEKIVSLSKSLKFLLMDVQYEHRDLIQCFSNFPPEIHESSKNNSKTRKQTVVVAQR